MLSHLHCTWGLAVITVVELNHFTVAEPMTQPVYNPYTSNPTAFLKVAVTVCNMMVDIGFGKLLFWKLSIEDRKSLQVYQWLKVNSDVLFIQYKLQLD